MVLQQLSITGVFSTWISSTQRPMMKVIAGEKCVNYKSQSDVLEKHSLSCLKCLVK